MSFEVGDKSWYVPLMGNDDESPRQKKNRIIREFQDVSFNLEAITEKLTPEYLEDIESLPESYVDAIVGCSFTQPSKKHRSLTSFDAFFRKFSELGEKTKKIVAAQAFKLNNAKEIDARFFTDELVFFHADQLAKKSANYGRTRKFFFYRSQRHALHVITQNIVNVLTPRGDLANNLGLLAQQVEEFKRYNEACLRLEQFPPHLKAAFFTNLYSVPADQQERREEIVAAADKIAEAIDLVITHKDSKHLFPNLTLFFAQTVIRQNFGQSLSAMSLKSFQAALVNIKSAKQLESLIRCLVYEVEISTFKGKYEDMLELCLIKLMEFSDPKEGLKLDSELLKKCLGIFNNYFWSSNRRNFLMTPDMQLRDQRVAKNLPIFYFIQRRLWNDRDVFANYPKIRELTVDYATVFNLERLPQAEEDFQQPIQNSLVRFDVQTLFETYLLNYPNSPVTMLLVRNYGANINIVGENGKRLLLWLIEQNGEMQNEGDIYNKYHNAINVLLQERVTVTQKDVEAAKKINTVQGRHLVERLGALVSAPEVLATQTEVVEGKGKEENQDKDLVVEEVNASPLSARLLQKVAADGSEHPVYQSPIKELGLILGVNQHEKSINGEIIDVGIKRKN